MAIPSFVSDLLGSMDVTPEIENNIKWSAASLYSGASDTVRILSSFSPNSRLTETELGVLLSPRLLQQFIRFTWSWCCILRFSVKLRQRSIGLLGTIGSRGYLIKTSFPMLMR